MLRYIKGPNNVHYLVITTHNTVGAGAMYNFLLLLPDSHGNVRHSW